MKRAQKVKLSLFREDPNNVSVATDEEIQRLAGKVSREERNAAGKAEKEARQMRRDQQPTTDD